MWAKLMQTGAGHSRTPMVGQSSMPTDNFAATLVVKRWLLSSGNSAHGGTAVEEGHILRVLPLPVLHNEM